MKGEQCLNFDYHDRFRPSDLKTFQFLSEKKVSKAGLGLFVP